MDKKNEADRGEFQSESGLPEGSKHLHLKQAVLDTSSDSEPERGETEGFHGQGHGVSMSQAPTSEKYHNHERKDAGYGKKDDKEREVTDPITHLPVMIHDFTSQNLKNALANIPLTVSQQRRSSDVGGNLKSKIQRNETMEGEEAHAGMEILFAPGRPRWVYEN
ncbi:hypothetical protein N7490_006782 [Penicillium lividum]|nr:hypothetical protein N7490_006782 [Penicillium lividum]